MTYTGDEYVAVDEDAVADDEALDTYVENCIRNNVAAVRALGHQVSWAPRSYDSDDHSQALRIRPYASYARSSILSVPWIVQDGQGTTHFSLHYRCGDEHSDNLSCFGWASLVGLGEERFSLANTDGATPEWQITEVELDLDEPFSGEVYTDLRVEQKGDVGGQILQSVVSHHVTTGGGLITASGAANQLLRHNGSNYPDADDRHVQIFENQNESSQRYDILWTSSGSNKGATRPGFDGAIDTPTDTARTRSLGYVQCRGIEVHSTWEGDTDLRPTERFHPHLIVDARDEVSHPLSIDRAYRRKRCLWIGPTGSLGDTELGWYTGYGPKHARITGNTSSAQILFPASIVPKTRSPKILILMNLLATYAPSLTGGIIENTASSEALDEESGEATWTIEASVTRFADGTSTPSSVTSADVEVELVHWPHLATPLYPCLQTELLYKAQLDGLNDEWPYKEGQMFEEDHTLIQRVAIELDLTSHNPSTNLDPYTITITGLTESVGDFPAGETVTASDLVLTCTGCTIWEVPR